VEAATAGVAGGAVSDLKLEAPSLLSLRDVTVRRQIAGAAVTVLDGVSLDVAPGEFVAVAGERRSGKTSLLRVAAGMEMPHRGVVRVGGRRITGVSGGARTRRAREVGFVPKELRLAPGRCVADHLMLALLASRVPLVTATARAHEALDRVGAIDLAGARPAELSGGQQALVALARALVHRPTLLLADEPGVMGQPEERSEVLRLLRGVARDTPGLGVLLTARDEAGIAGATRVLTLDAGRLTNVTPEGRVIPLPARAR
jgi:ABC-type methionine transport system ATPase subunit